MTRIITKDNIETLSPDLVITITTIEKATTTILKRGARISAPQTRADGKHWDGYIPTQRAAENDGAEDVAQLAFAKLLERRASLTDTHAIMSAVFASAVQLSADFKGMTGAPRSARERKETLTWTWLEKQLDTDDNYANFVDACTAFEGSIDAFDEHMDGEARRTWLLSHLTENQREVILKKEQGYSLKNHELKLLDRAKHRISDLLSPAEPVKGKALSQLSAAIDQLMLISSPRGTGGHTTDSWPDMDDTIGPVERAHEAGTPVRTGRNRFRVYNGKRFEERADLRTIEVSPIQKALRKRWNWTYERVMKAAHDRMLYGSSGEPAFRPLSNGEAILHPLLDIAKQPSPKPEPRKPIDPGQKIPWPSQDPSAWKHA